MVVSFLSFSVLSSTGRLEFEYDAFPSSLQIIFCQVQNNIHSARKKHLFFQDLEYQPSGINVYLRVLVWFQREEDQLV
jgi:hypothetical protein